jgi:hypothetical protein
VSASVPEARSGSCAVAADYAFAEADVISALQTSEGLVIDVRTDGVSGVMRDMMAPRKKVAAE